MFVIKIGELLEHVTTYFPAHLGPANAFLWQVIFLQILKNHLFSLKTGPIWYLCQVGDQIRVEQHPGIDVWHWILSLGAERLLQPVFGLI